jgi:hypothetical protein
MPSATVGDANSRLDKHFDAPWLVFVGIGLHWPSRPSDLGRNTALAEDWQENFGHWNIEERVVSLQDRNNLYRVMLTDGSAQFLIETVPGYQLALSHVPQLLAGLPANTRANCRGRMEAQYLRPWEGNFAERVSGLAPRLMNERFPTSLPGQLKDFAYLSDVAIEKTMYQLSIGVVKKSELPHRVKATLKSPPAVATFCNIAQHWEAMGTAEDCTNALSRTLSVGRSIMSEVE